MFSSNRHHPNGFFGVINLAALGQIMLERGANVSFINNTGMYVYAIDLHASSIYTSRCYC